MLIESVPVDVMGTRAGHRFFGHVVDRHDVVVFSGFSFDSADAEAWAMYKAFSTAFQQIRGSMITFTTISESRVTVDIGVRSHRSRASLKVH